LAEYVALIYFFKKVFFQLRSSARQTRVPGALKVISRS
jgi:ABC-type uncharacterized transport system YnjBCD permease subunit